MATEHILIEDEAMIDPYCVVVAGNHLRRDGSYRFGEDELEPIRIRRGSWVGSHVVVTAGGSIGLEMVIAPGAVVTTWIPDNVLAGGLPARLIKMLPSDLFIHVST